MNTGLDRVPRLLLYYYDYYGGGGCCYQTRSTRRLMKVRPPTSLLLKGFSGTLAISLCLAPALFVSPLLAQSTGSAAGSWQVPRTPARPGR